MPKGKNSNTKSTGGKKSASKKQTATVINLIPNKKYSLELYQFASKYGGTNKLEVGGNTYSVNANNQGHVTPSWSGIVTSTASGTIVLTFTRLVSHMHFSALHVVAIDD